MARSKPKKDPVALIISIVVHGVVIGGVLFWVSTTEKGKELARRFLQAVRSEKKETQEPPKQPRAQPPPSKLPPINQGVPQQASSGSRRAVAADAPASAGESFFVDQRKQTTDASGGGSGAASNAPVLRVALPPPVIVPPRLFASAPQPSTIKQLLAERAKASASIEAIGSEQISRAGASDAGGVVNKVAGATIVDGKFAVIRGLSDRYVSTTLNGVNLPSADPYRQSVPLDLFPAQVIDRVVVTKTFTPEQQGTATGGGIDIVTKSFPERDFLTVSLGAEYNTQASLNDRFLSYAGGGHDWAALDDGSRALPDEVSQLVPIGTRLPAAPATSGVIGTPLYTNTLRSVDQLDKVSRALGITDFAPKKESAPLNHNFSMAGGGSTHLLEKPLGYFGSVSYKHDYASYEDGISRRYESGTRLKNDYRDARSLSTVNWSGMINLAYKPLEDQEFGFTFFYNQNATDDARIQDLGTEANSSGGTYRKYNLYWTERNLTTYQMKGDHRFPDAGGLRFNWLYAITTTSQDEPNARFFNDVDTGSGYTTENSSLPSPSKPTRYFRALDEDNKNLKLDWTLPFRQWSDDEGLFKFGLFDSRSTRGFTERQFYYDGGSRYSNDPNFYLIANQPGLTSVTTNFVRGRPRSLSFNWGEYAQVFDSLYSGERGIQAGYLMLDLPTVKNVRVVGGVRYETTDMSVHSESYLDSSVTSLKTNDTKLVQSDVLPAIGMICPIGSNMNVRLNFSKTIARPSFRELAAYYSYDPLISDFVEGNPRLQMTSIVNYDLRWEWFPHPGELVSVSVFYKDLKNAIERGNLTVAGDVITFLNNDAKLYGIEFEGRKSLDFLGPQFNLFSLGGNFSLLKSEVLLSDSEYANKAGLVPGASRTRPLYDQSPYILNLDFNFNNPASGTAAALIFNLSGPRIAITKLNTDDVYDLPPPSLDLVISQKISRNTTLRFSAKNLLDPRIERTYGKDSDLIYSSYTRGRTFGLSLSREF